MCKHGAHSHTLPPAFDPHAIARPPLAPLGPLASARGHSAACVARGRPCSTSSLGPANPLPLEDDYVDHPPPDTLRSQRAAVPSHQEASLEHAGLAHHTPVAPVPPSTGDAALTAAGGAADEAAAQRKASAKASAAARAKRYRDAKKKKEADARAAAQEQGVAQAVAAALAGGRAALAGRCCRRKCGN